MDALDELVDDLAALMGAPCILEDPDFRLLGFSEQHHADPIRQRSILERGSSSEVREWFYAHGIAEAETPLRTPEDLELGIVSRVCIPVRHHGRLRGFFWLLDAKKELKPTRWQEAAPFAEAAGALLSLAERRQARRDAQYRDVIEGGAGGSRSAAVELAAAAGLLMDAPVRVAVIERPDLATQLASRPSRNGMLWVRESGGLCAAILSEDFEASTSDLSRVLSALGLARRMPALDRRTTVGLGPVVRGMDHLPEGRAGAMVALRVGRQRRESVTTWDGLGPLTLLGVARDADLARALLPSRVREFIGHGSPPLVDTARIFLQEAGSVARTSSRLNVHRQTVYHRLKEVENLTGVNLADGNARVNFQLALELAPYLMRDVDSR